MVTFRRVWTVGGATVLVVACASNSGTPSGESSGDAAAESTGQVGQTGHTSASSALASSSATSNKTNASSSATVSSPSVSDTATSSSTRTSTSSSTSSSSTSKGPCVPPTTGTAGFTTRFWDCCKPSCGWNGVGLGNVPNGQTPLAACSVSDQKLTSFTTPNACPSGSAYACSDLSPFVDPNDPNTSYAFAAFNGGNCGDCYDLVFTGQSNSVSSDPGSQAICGEHLIVQVVNIGGIQANQFDIMVPGGGVGANNACATEWGTSNLGAQFGGFLGQCQSQSSYGAVESCTKNFCSTVFTQASQSNFLAGCNWQVDWLKAANNPKMMYQKVTCPAALTALTGF